MKFKELIKLYYSGDLRILYLNETFEYIYFVEEETECLERLEYKLTFEYGFRYRKINGLVSKRPRTHHGIPMQLPYWFVRKLKNIK